MYSFHFLQKIRNWTNLHNALLRDDRHSFILYRFKTFLDLPESLVMNVNTELFLSEKEMLAASHRGLWCYNAFFRTQLLRTH